MATSQDLLNADLNLATLDGVVTSDAESVNDRLGQPKLTIAEIQRRSEAAVAAAGFYPVAGSFEAGGTITERNQVLLRTTAPAAYFSWGGALPKVVPPSSTVAGTGGEGVTAWTNRNDATLAAALAAGTADIGGSTAATVGALANGIVIAAEYLIGPATPSGAVMAAIAAAGQKSVFIGNQFDGLELFNIQVNPNQDIICVSGWFNTTSDNPTFILSMNSSVKGAKIRGSGKDSGLTNQVAYLIPSTAILPLGRTRVTDTIIEDMGGAAYRGGYLVNDHEGSLFTNYHINSCNIGLDVVERFEYLNAGFGNVTNCNTGIKIAGGNLNLSSFVASDNDIGVHIVAGDNDAHGQITGGMFNHNITRTVLVDSPNNGFLFTGSQFFNGGAIELKDCSNIWFRNGVKSAVPVLEDNCFRCGFVGFELRDGADNTPNIGGVPSEVFYFDNLLPDSVAAGSSERIRDGYLSLTKVGNLTISATTLDLDLGNIAAHRIANNTAYSKQTFYTVGDPLVKAGDVKIRGDINVNVDSQLTFGKSGAPAWNSSQVRVKLVDSLGNTVGRYIPQVDDSVGASNYITYVFNGSVVRRNFKIVVENATGGNIVLVANAANSDVKSYMDVRGW